METDLIHVCFLQLFLQVWFTGKWNSVKFVCTTKMKLIQTETPRLRSALCSAGDLRSASSLMFTETQTTTAPTTNQIQLCACETGSESVCGEESCSPEDESTSQSPFQQTETSRKNFCRTPESPNISWALGGWRRRISKQRLLSLDVSVWSTAVLFQMKQHLIQDKFKTFKSPSSGRR